MGACDGCNAGVGSRIALKMCDLSAHAYRTSYVDIYIHVWPACSAVAFNDSRIALKHG